jgi:thymidylate kinase
MGHRIILEGVDGAGKTTLAKILANEYGLDYCHCGKTDPCDYAYYRQSIRKDNIVWDRHVIGELIYPTVFNRKSQCCPEDARIVLSLGKQDLGLKTIVLTADDDVIMNRLLARGDEDPLILAQEKWINAQFIWYAKHFNLPIIDTSKMSLNDIFSIIKA